MSKRVFYRMVIFCISMFLFEHYLAAEEKVVLFDSGNTNLPKTKKTGALKPRPKPDYAVTIPDTITGTVYIDKNGNKVRDNGEKGCERVSVTDGYSVVSTDSNGMYSLRPSKYAVYIYITRPSGYDVVGDWYKPLKKEVNFNLAPSCKNENQYTFIHVTDTHLSDLAKSMSGLQKFVDEVNRLSPPPLFVINSGDLITLTKGLTTPASVGHKYFRDYCRIMDQLNMPHYNVAGDHTDSRYLIEKFPIGDHRCGKPLFWEYLGPNLFSFEYGKIHFVMIDYVYHHAPGKSKSELTPEQLKWLEEDLKHRTEGTVVVTASESVLQKVIPNFYEFGRKYDIVLQIIGDDHVYTYEDTPIPSRTGGALSASWWYSTISTDLTPRGYVIYRVRGTELDEFFKGLNQQIAIEAPTFGQSVSGAMNILARFVQGADNSKLEYSVNDGEWTPMRPAVNLWYRKTFKSSFDTTSQPDGLATLRIRSTTGEEIRDCVFVIDNKTKFVAKANATLEFNVGKVITARKYPKKTIDVIFNEKNIGVVSGKKTNYSFNIPHELLKKVNHLLFKPSDENDWTSVSNMKLLYMGNTITDPRRGAIMDVVSQSWLRGHKDGFGSIIGKGVRETSFANKQERFCFVLPANVTPTANVGRESVIIWKDISELIPQPGWCPLWGMVE